MNTRRIIPALILIVVLFLSSCSASITNLKSETFNPNNTTSLAIIKSGIVSSTYYLEIFQIHSNFLGNDKDQEAQENVIKQILQNKKYDEAWFHYGFNNSTLIVLTKK